MLTAVYFLSVYQAQKIAGRSDTVVVSIRDRHFTPKLQTGFRDVLPLFFDDHDDARDGVDEQACRFGIEHAQTLRTWLGLHVASPEPLLFMVHCHAGISRSAAIAWWVHREFGVPLRTTFPAYFLNRHVLKVLNPTLDLPNMPERSVVAKVDFERFFNEDDEWPECGGAGAA